MASKERVQFEALRSIAFGAISGTYAVLGTPLSNPARIIKITNNTDADLLATTDSSQDEMFLPKNSFVLFDLSANKFTNESYWLFAKNTQFYIKESATPTTGSVYLEALG